MEVFSREFILHVRDAICHEAQDMVLASAPINITDEVLRILEVAAMLQAVDVV